MRLTGRLERWDDQRGFGFVDRGGDHGSVFVHISAFPKTDRRPKTGDLISYELLAGKDGKARAGEVRFKEAPAARPRRRPRPSATPTPNRMPWLFLAVLILLGLAERLAWTVVLGIPLLSALTYLVYAWDKSSARRGEPRTPESWLHLLGLLGGWPGALAAQRRIRHKSSKLSFLRVFWLTVWVNVSVLAYLAWVGDPGVLDARLLEWLGI